MFVILIEACDHSKYNLSRIADKYFVSLKINNCTVWVNEDVC